MSGPEPHPPDDRLLQEFLDGQGEVTRAYRASTRPTAPPELEPAVLQIARDALGRPVIRQRRPPWLQRWRLPLAAAASLLLSLGVLLNLQQDRELRGQAFDMAVMPPPAPQVPESQRGLQEETIAAAPVSAAAPETESMPAAASMASPKPRAAREARATQDRSAKLERRAKPLSMTAPAAVASAAAAPPAADAEPQADTGTEADALMMAASPAPESAMADEAADAMAPAMTATPEQAAASTSAPAPPAVAKSARMAPAFAAAAMTEPAPPPAPMEPAAWLQRIVQLRDRPDLEAARRELAEFRKVYPQYPLPEDLKSLLP